MASAWVYQDDKQVKERGEQAASWYVGWYDPEGKRKCKSCGPGEQGKRNADKLRRKVEAELMCGVYRDKLTTTWETFRRDYEERIASTMEPSTRDVTIDALNHFARIVKPVRVFALNAAHIDEYVAVRRQERGRRKGSVVSVATINKELRHLRAVLRIAQDWGHLPSAPRFKMLRESFRLPTYITGDDFAAIYAACEHATKPRGLPYTAAEWWQALLTTGYLTGWRISEMMALRRDDVDFESGCAITQAADNKGKRDERVKLHVVVLEHIKQLAGFSPFVFAWPHNGRTLYSEFARIQEAAQIHLPCDEEHEHTRYCHVYGFHDLRRAFATMNADKLTADALQTLMRHKSYQTTQKYINMARQMDEAVGKLHVPDFLRKDGTQS